MKSSSQSGLPTLCIKKKKKLTNNNNNNKGNMMLVWKSIPPSPQYIYNTDQEILIKVMKVLVLPWPYLGRRKVTEEAKRASSLLFLNNSESRRGPLSSPRLTFQASSFRRLVTYLSATSAKAARQQNIGQNKTVVTTPPPTGGLPHLPRLVSYNMTISPVVFLTCPDRLLQHDYLTCNKHKDA